MRWSRLCQNLSIRHDGINILMIKYGSPSKLKGYQGLDKSSAITGEHRKWHALGMIAVPSLWTTSRVK